MAASRSRERDVLRPFAPRPVAKGTLKVTENSKVATAIFLRFPTKFKPEFRIASDWRPYAVARSPVCFNRVHWRYDQCIANADDDPDRQEFWRALKDQEQENMKRLKQFAAVHIEKDRF